jgi:hypothetical protein
MGKHVIMKPRRFPKFGGCHLPCVPLFRPEHGNVMEIAEKFGSEGRLLDAITLLPTLFYET